MAQSKESAYNAGNLSSIPGLGRSPGEENGNPPKKERKKENGNPLQYSCLENLMDGGPWWATVHRVETSQMQMGDFFLHFLGGASDKELACQFR